MSLKLKLQLFSKEGIQILSVIMWLKNQAYDRRHFKLNVVDQIRRYFWANCVSLKSSNMAHYPSRHLGPRMTEAEVRKALLV